MKPINPHMKNINNVMYVSNGLLVMLASFNIDSSLLCKDAIELEFILDDITVSLKPKRKRYKANATSRSTSCHSSMIPNPQRMIVTLNPDNAQRMIAIWINH